MYNYNYTLNCDASGCSSDSVNTKWYDNEWIGGVVDDGENWYVGSFVAKEGDIPSPEPTPTPIPDPNINSIEGFNYFVSNTISSNGVSRDLVADIIDRNTAFSAGSFRYPLDSITATYSNDNGFRGHYSYNGRTGDIVSDVSIEVSFYQFSDPYLTGYIGTGKDIVIGGDHFGHIRIGLTDITGNGKFRYNSPHLSNSGNFSFDQTGYVKGAFSNDGSSISHPNYIAGEVQVKGFSKDFYDDHNPNNSLVGVFVAEKD